MQTLLWQESLTLQIVHARRKLKQLYLAHLSDVALTPPQVNALLCLNQGGEQCLGALARMAGSDEPTASRVVTRLVAAGLVRINPDAKDRRRARIALTPAGKAMARRMSSVAAEVEAEIRAELTPAELKVLASGLRKIAAGAQRAAERLEARPPKRRAAR